MASSKYPPCMRFALRSAHIDTFREEGQVSIEELVERDVCEKAAGVIVGGEARRDLWRHHPEVKAISCKRNLAHVAGELGGRFPVQIAYDQWIDGERGTPETLGSVQGLIGALLLTLSGAEAGNGIYLAPNAPLPSELLGVTLLVAYAHKPVYVQNENDPHNHELKNEGYGFGDRLSIETHPILARR